MCKLIKGFAVHICPDMFSHGATLLTSLSVIWKWYMYHVNTSGLYLVLSGYDFQKVTFFETFLGNLQAVESVRREWNAKQKCQKLVVSLLSSLKDCVLQSDTDLCKLLLIQQLPLHTVSNSTCLSRHVRYTYYTYPNTLYLIALAFPGLFGMVNVLKFLTLYSLLFWSKFCFLCTCLLKYLVEWQTM